MAIYVRDLRGRLATISMLCVSLSLLLSGCGGGDSGVGIAEGQSPDPVLVEVPIAYVKRPLPMDDMGGIEPEVASELLVFEVGADLYLRERASPTAEERNLTADITQGLGDVRDVDVSWDGTKVVFAMRGPLDPNLDEDDEDQPTWNIWEYNSESDVLRRVIVSDTRAEEGHDLAPHYLPDGRILFSSTRQRESGAILTNEGKLRFAAQDEDREEPAFVLHVMDEDGNDIEQISFNQSHDLDPSVMTDGKIVFSRWDNVANNDGIHLYRANPDGSGLELLYGRNSHDTGTNGTTIEFLQPREMPDGRLLTVIHQPETVMRGGDLAAIEIASYLENTQPTSANAGVLGGPAQVRPVVNDVRTDGSISPGGLFASAFPLWDGTGRLLVSWSQCAIQEGGNTVPCTPDRLADPASQPAPPAYGIWVYDVAEGTQVPILPPETGMIFNEVVALQARGLPPVIPDVADGGADPDLLTEGTGIINIRSVYDVDGTATVNIDALADPLVTAPDDRPARFLRLVKAVGIPDDEILDIDNTAFGRSTQNGMREILGYAPVEPDGSVRVKVPANVPLQISVLDVQGRRIGPRHNAWLQVRPGEVLNCSGCHDGTSGLSHGRSDAFDSAWAGQANPSTPFPNTNPAIFADFGETMAEARARFSCGAENCASITPSVDIEYEDVWTDPGLQTPAAPFAYRYADLQTSAPAADQCQTTWAPICRTVIHYETHIQPIWELPRVDGANNDATCISCHVPIPDANNPGPPEGQLDLSGTPDPVVAEHFVSYRELMFADNEQVFDPVQGILVDRLIDQVIIVDVEVVDPVTGEITIEQQQQIIQVPVPVPPSMSVAGARNSGRFFDRFNPGGTHEGRLTEAELKLISEWLDIGGQYYNDPFAAPVN